MQRIDPLRPFSPLETTIPLGENAAHLTSIPEESLFASSHTPYLPAPTIMVKEQVLPSPRLILVAGHDLEFGAFLVQAIKQKTACKAILASNEAKALKIIEYFKCHLLLLDYHIAGTSGFELYDLLHTIKGYEETPALFFCANTFLKHRLTDHSMLIELETLLQNIHNLLDPDNKNTALPSYRL